MVLYISVDDILYWIQGSHFIHKLVHHIMARYEVLTYSLY